MPPWLYDGLVSQEDLSSILSENFLLLLGQVIHSRDLIGTRLCLSSVERFPYVDIFLSRTTGQIFTVLVSNTCREIKRSAAVDLILGLKLLKKFFFIFNKDQTHKVQCLYYR